LFNRENFVWLQKCSTQYKKQNFHAVQTEKNQIDKKSMECNFVHEICAQEIIPNKKAKLHSKQHLHYAND